ncbi:unnamed protein product [Ectocarpus sp. 12 AP-2014]
MSGKCWIWQMSTSPRDSRVFSNAIPEGLMYSRVESRICKGRERKNRAHLYHNSPWRNPDPLVFGSPTHNARDIVRHGTSNRHELNPEAVRQIRSSKKTNSE